MASIKQRGNSYLIRSSCGYDSNGKKLMKNMTWTPDPGMTTKQIEKELNRQAVMFDEKCKRGVVLDSKMTFEKYVNCVWIKRAENDLKPTTFRRYKLFLRRIIPAIGHYKMELIQPFHLYSFYDDLREEKRMDTKYTPNEKAHELSMTLTRLELSRQVGIGLGTVDVIRAGKNVNENTAVKFADFFNCSVTDLFTPDEKKLSDLTILHHHRLISTIMQQAVYDEVIQNNPCARTRSPRVERTEARFLDDDQAELLLNTVYDKAGHPFDVIIPLILHTGMRRGEACGLEWQDIDFDNNIIHIQRTTQYLPEKGVFEEETKTFSSKRVIKVGGVVIDMLREFKIWQDNEADKLGDKWEDSRKVFTAWDGRPINPCTVTAWFHRFIIKNDLPYISIHGLRHTNASLLISSGVPITTTAKRLGHTTSATTSKIYAHAINSADAMAATAIESILPRRRKNA